jgi:hypothetical protein
VKILFIARTWTYFRNYDAAIRLLAARGHRVHLAVEIEDKLAGGPAIEALAAECPGVTLGSVPAARRESWSAVASRLRLAIDYLRYLDPFYDTAPLRRVRARTRTPAPLAAFANPPLVGGPRWRRAYARLLHAVDAAVPPPPAVVEYVRGQAPDVMVITPLVDLGSQQIDYVRAARELGIPCALAVWSWDHLTSKALLREYPERVLVWNDVQRHEAVAVHGVPPERVRVTGAQAFDHWFERGPVRTREQLCAQLALPPDRPIVMYVCTGLIQGSPPEIDFVREWLGWLRGSSDPGVAGASVLIRPYPSTMAAWKEADLSALGPVAVWGGNPVDERSREDYFDSLYHSATIVGLNTSAFIEAAIVGRQVLTILVPRFHDNQMGTAHFRYLLEVGGGILRVARTREEHLAQLGSALRHTPDAHPHSAFLEAFLRPAGLDRPATPGFVGAIEELGACAAVPVRPRAPKWIRGLLDGAVRGVWSVAGPAPQPGEQR